MARAVAAGGHVDQFEVRHSFQLCASELAQQGQAGRTEQVSEELDALPITALEEGIGLSGVP